MFINKKRCMLLICVSIILSSFNVFADLQKVFVLELNYNKGMIKENSLYVTPIFYNEEKDQPVDGYLLNLISNQDKELFRLNFYFPLEVYDIPGKFFLDQVNITLYVPYTKEAKNIEIFNPNGEQMLNINIERFVKNVCGDLICDIEENYEKCSMDCPKPIEKQEFFSMKTVYSFILLMVLAIVLIYLYRKRKSKK